MSDAQQVAKERRGTARSWVSGARWHGLKEMLYDGAVRYGLDLRILDESKGWFRHTVYYEVAGLESRVRAFGNAIRQFEGS